MQRPVLLFKGLITTHDVELAIERVHAESSSELLRHPWQERRVVEVMDTVPLYASPTTSLGAAARLLVECERSCLPVIEYQEAQEESKEEQSVLIGLLTRSDLMMALARTLGAFETGMPLTLPLPDGSTEPLTTALHLAAELHVCVRSLIVASSTSGRPEKATLYLGTINPTPLLLRLQQAGINYAYAQPLAAENAGEGAQVRIPT